MARWDKIQSRGRVDDRRGRGGGMVVGGGIGTLLLIMGVTYFLGGDPMQVLIDADPSMFQQQSVSTNDSRYEGEDEYEVFASTVLGSNNAYWDHIFEANDLVYQEPTLVLFRGATSSGCGSAQSLAGPHYCPADASIYLDETFFEELVDRFGARGGDVAEAYVISHETAHHVQNQLGLLQARRTNKQSIAIELQADCFAGLWAHSIRQHNVFEKNEILEAMDAAASVGDDRIQKSTTGYVHPESWTHGSSEDRVHAFVLGYESGNVTRCLDYTSS